MTQTAAVTRSASEVFGAALEDGSFYENPGPVWAMLREAGPIAKIPFRGETWVVTNWAACSALSRDSRLSAARAVAYDRQLPPEHRHEMQPMIATLSEMVIFMDPPRHTQLRKIMARAFTPEVIERSRPRIARLFDQLLDDWIAAGRREITETVIHPFPALVIADWIGLPPEDFPRFLEWANALLKIIGSPTSDIEQTRVWIAAVEESRRYLDAAAAHHQPGDESLFSLLMEMEEGEVLDRAQLVAQAMLILFAGHETTRNLIAGGLHLLLSHGYDCREFLADDLSVRLAVDEVLRIVSPVQVVGRLVDEDFQYDGVSLKKGEYILLGWASANRDPEQFSDPDKIDLKRRNNPHLAFGAGMHACLGLHLARVEAQIAFQRLWSRLPNLRLSPQPVEWTKNLAIRGPARLYVDYDRV